LKIKNANYVEEDGLIAISSCMGNVEKLIIEGDFEKFPSLQGIKALSRVSEKLDKPVSC